jgi:hypothetical protein
MPTLRSKLIVVVLFHSRGTSNGGIGGSVATVLVRRPTETTTTVLEGLYNRYREQVLPFIASRPDLVKLVQEKKTTYYDLPALLHAFNTGEPYQPKR